MKCQKHWDDKLVVGYTCSVAALYLFPCKFVCVWWLWWWGDKNVTKSSKKRRMYVWYDKDDVVEWRRQRYDVKLSSMCCKNFYRDFFLLRSVSVYISSVRNADCQIDAKKDVLSCSTPLKL